jgi:hypothetical protein
VRVKVTRSVLMRTGPFGSSGSGGVGVGSWAKRLALIVTTTTANKNDLFKPLIRLKLANLKTAIILPVNLLTSIV